MTSTTDPAARLAALYAVLAAATVECPYPAPEHWLKDGLCLRCNVEGSWLLDVPCSHEGPNDVSGRDPCICQGTGDGSARFEGFRQPCGRCDGRGRYKTTHPLLSGDPEWVVCNGCNGRRYQVHAGGLAAGLAGLSFWEFWEWRQRFAPIPVPVESPETTPMPTGAEIDEAGLRLVCQVAELEVP